MPVHVEEVVREVLDRIGSAAGRDRAHPDTGTPRTGRRDSGTRW
jgi:hypothetical protein